MVAAFVGGPMDMFRRRGPGSSLTKSPHSKCSKDGMYEQERGIGRVVG